MTEELSKGSEARPGYYFKYSLLGEAVVPGTKD